MPIPAAIHEGGLDKLADKRVAIIGTGATAIQCVPHLARHAKHLYVFQRTPSSVDLRGNRPTDPDWVKSLTPGWQKRRMENFNILVSGGHQDEDLVSDGWTDIIPQFGDGGGFAAAGRCVVARRDGARDGAVRLPEDEPDPRARGCDRARIRKPPRR